ncbi:hypothetical protein HaLaN_04618, partial [Haematococcus lacustris]
MLKELAWEQLHLGHWQEVAPCSVGCDRCGLVL